MPNRIIRDGIIDSPRIERLVREAGWPAEVFYRRLQQVVDDFGRFDGRVSMLKARCYPTVLDLVSDADVEKWIEGCVRSGLLLAYEAKGQRFLEVIDFRQQTRAKSSKCPAPPSGCAADAAQMNSNCALYSYSETYSETHTKSETGASDESPTLEEKSNPDKTPPPTPLPVASGPRDTWQVGRTQQQQEFIDAFPKKLKPKLAANAYEAAIAHLVGSRGITDAEAHEWLMGVVRRYAKSPAGAEPTGAKDYRPSAHQWLESESFDEPESAWQYTTGDAKPRNGQTTSTVRSRPVAERRKASAAASEAIGAELEGML